MRLFRGTLKLVTLMALFLTIGCARAADGGNTMTSIMEVNSGESNSKDLETVDNNRDRIIYTYNPDGTVKQTQEMFYDKKTGLVEYHITESFGANPWKTKYENEYDSNKQKIGMCVYDMKDGTERLVSSYAYEYDTEGRIIREYHYGNGTKRDNPLSRKEYDYNGKDEKTGIEYNSREKHYNTPDFLTGYVLKLDDRRQEYDKDGNLTEEWIYNNSGYTKENVKKQEEETTKYEFDGSGNQIGYKVYDKNGNLIQYVEYR